MTIYDTSSVSKIGALTFKSLAFIFSIMILSGCNGGNNSQFKLLEEGAVLNPNKVTVIGRVSISPAISSDGIVLVEGDKIPRKPFKLSSGADLSDPFGTRAGKISMKDPISWIEKIETESFYAIEFDPIPSIFFSAVRSKIKSNLLDGTDFITEVQIEKIAKTLTRLKAGNVYYLNTLKIDLDDTAYFDEAKTRVKNLIPKSVRLLNEKRYAQEWARASFISDTPINLISISNYTGKINADVSLDKVDPPKVNYYIPIFIK